MAVQRNDPYPDFNFLVDLGTGHTNGPQAGFQEVGPIATGVDVIEYRNGNDPANSVRKITGLNRCADVTLRRGLIGALDLYQWIDQVRSGDPASLRTVSIQLMSEDQSGPVFTWRLLRARPVKYVTGPLNAQGRSVALEEIVLAYERLEID